VILSKLFVVIISQELLPQECFKQSMIVTHDSLNVRPKARLVN